MPYPGKTPRFTDVSSSHRRDSCTTFTSHSRRDFYSADRGVRVQPGGGTFISFYVTVRRFLFAGRRTQRFLQLPGRRPTSRHSGTRHKTHGGDCAIVTRTFPGLLETKSGRRKKSQKSIFLFSCSKPRWWSGKGDTDARRTLPTYCYVFHIME